jgi:hypothetical protein
MCLRVLFRFCALNCDLMLMRVTTFRGNTPSSCATMKMNTVFHLICWYLLPDEEVSTKKAVSFFIGIRVSGIMCQCITFLAGGDNVNVLEEI